MMKQPYSCQQEVSEGVRWDRKRSPEPNLHVYGEDDIKRAVYNMKESIEEEDWNIKKETENTQEEKLRNQRTVLCFKEKLIVISVLIYL